MKRAGNVALQQATDGHFKQYVEHEDLLQVVYYLQGAWRCTEEALILTSCPMGDVSVFYSARTTCTPQRGN